jgi:competence ComEA-like helix-hairpin-helix protein
MANLLFQNVLPFLLPPPPKIDFSVFAAQISKIEATPLAAVDKTNPFQRRNIPPATAPQLFVFDPNTARKSDLLTLGLSERIAQTILNYRLKGGRFYKKEDLKKVFGMRPEDYDRLAPWVVIGASGNQDSGQSLADRSALASQVEYKPNYEKKPLKKGPVSIDINQSNQVDWQQLPGIGPGYAKRIIHFREKLGGFASVEQVKETYGLPDSTFQKIKPLLQPSPIFRPINLNDATLEELKAHPLISNFLATILFNYRKQHGAFPDLAAAQKAGMPSLKEGDWERLLPYLSLD